MTNINCLLHSYYEARVLSSVCCHSPGQGRAKEVLSPVRAEAVVLRLPAWFGNVTLILDHFMFLTP